MDDLSDPVFWAEGDDDAIRIAEVPHLPQLSLAAYLLLNKRIVLHPAYLWQSSLTHRLITEGHDTIVAPGSTNIILGNSSSINEYISERMRLLSQGTSTHFSQSELNQYLRHGNALHTEADSFDERFVKEGGVHPIHWSRDHKFRECIRSDLSNEQVFGPHLRAVIYRMTSASRRDTTIKRLVTMTYDTRRVVSVDSVKRIAIKNGFPQNASGPLDSRLHVLHWFSHDGDGLEVPLLSQVDGRKLHPSNPLVFWCVMDRLLGTGLRQAVCWSDWKQVSYLIGELRNDVLWRQFIHKYSDVVMIVNENVNEFAEEVVTKELTRMYPGMKSILTNAPISKWGWLSIVCTLLGIGSGIGVIGAIGAVGTLGDGIINIVNQFITEFSEGRNALRTYPKTSRFSRKTLCFKGFRQRSGGFRIGTKSADRYIASGTSIGVRRVKQAPGQELNLIYGYRRIVEPSRTRSVKQHSI